MSLATTWVDLEGITLGEISQAEKEEYCMVSLIYGILKKKKHRKRDQICGYRDGGGRGETGGKQSKVKTSSYQISTRDVRYSRVTLADTALRYI